MSTTNTGYERSLYATFSKYVNGVLQPTYPHVYDGRLEFSHGGVTFPVITNVEFSLLSTNDFNVRLTAFKAYVALTESVPSIDPYIVPGFGPIRFNPSDCAVGAPEEPPLD